MRGDVVAPVSGVSRETDADSADWRLGFLKLHKLKRGLNTQFAWKLKNHEALSSFLETWTRLCKFEFKVCV